VDEGFTVILASIIFNSIIILGIIGIFIVQVDIIKKNEQMEKTIKLLHKNTNANIRVLNDGLQTIFDSVKELKKNKKSSSKKITTNI